MLDAWKSFFGRHATPSHAGDAESSERALRIAACALLLEVAHADDAFTSEERAQIEEALVRHFEIEPEAARELIELAEEERQDATDLYRFTALVNRHYDEGQRMVLAELIWRVVYADGTLSKHENELAQKLANLLDLRPGYLTVARKRATEGPSPSSTDPGSTDTGL